MAKLSFHITTRGRRERKNRRGIAAVLAALIFFAMVFTTGFGYLIFVTNTSQTINQASAARQNTLLQAGQEALLTKVLLVGGNTLVLMVNNTGGVPVTLNEIYLTDNSGILIKAVPGTNPPGFIGVAGGSNATANWPISLPVGQSTKTLAGCATGKAGCNIALNYVYAGVPVTAEIVTSNGNTFGAPYPPAAIVTQTNGNVLVVNMVATPTQTLSCTNCLTLTVTVYNYATSAVTSVALSPSPPTAQVTGTATITGGLCTGPLRWNGTPMVNDSITAYSGSGNAHYVYYTCTYSASTGAVGGVGSFSTSATGSLGGAGVSSAVSISNSVQIGGSANVPTQGAFAANYFFLKYSACTNTPAGSAGSYTYATPCTTAPVTMPPATLGALANGNYISSVTSHYVTYYVQVTNDFNTTLPLLEYSYLFMDPGISTEAYSFLIGTATSPQVPYFPNYCSGGGSPACAGNNLPVFTPYAATAATCAESAPSYNPPPPTACIDVAPGQTVTLAFASCGFGASNWVWGGTTYGQQLDSNVGCTTTPPGYQNNVPEGQTFAIVLSYLYKNQVYNQVMPFEGQTVTNQRASTTSLSCVPSPDPVNVPSTCTATVTDTSSGTVVTPTGTVSFSQSPGGGGVFGTGGACTLSGAGATATCTVTYTPSPGQEITDTLAATYPGDTNHAGSTGQTTLTATKRTTSTAIVCTPAAAVPNTPTNCVVTVSDTSAGIAVTPTGVITFTQNPALDGTFSPAATCTLSSGTCSVTYTPNNGLLATVTITATYGGDTDHSGSSGSQGVTWANKKVTATSVSCSPVSFGVGSSSSCTATLTGFTAPVTGETITFSQNGGTGTVSFVSTTCALSAGGTCSVTITGQTAGSPVIMASYPGDAQNLASSGTQTVTVTSKAAVSIARTVTLCTNPGGSSCSGSVPGVVSGDLMVVVISTERQSSTCAAVTSVTGSQDSAYAAVPNAPATATNNLGGNPDCVYNTIWYATVTTSGSDTITVNLNHPPDSGVVVVYELKNALTPATAQVGTCVNPSCSTSIVVSPTLAYVANSFLVTAAATCIDTGGNPVTINTKPAGFTTNYGTGQIEYVGNQLSAGSGNQNFQMTDSAHAQCWSIIGAQFVDPPPPPGWNPGIVDQAGLTVPSLPQLLDDAPLFGVIFALAFAPFLALGGSALLTRLGIGSRGRRRRQERS